MLNNIDDCKGLDMKLCQLAEENNLTDEQFRYFTKGWQALWGMINKLPSVDKRRGMWIDKGWKGDWQYETDGRGNCWHEYECSECGFHSKGSKSNYCPNCGCRMRGADNERQ